MKTKDIGRLYSSLRVQCKDIGLVNLLAGFSLYLDAEIDFYDMQASEENREPLKSVFRNEFEKLSSMKSDVDTCINALVNKSSDDNSVPQYNCKGGGIERLTEEESKELGELLNTEISDYLDTSLVIVHEKGKQLAIRQANLYKRIYNKLIKPIFKVEE